MNIENLRHITAEFVNEWARLLVPHFGSAGSMDLDLQFWEDAEGPSYYNQFSHYTFLLLASGRIPGCDQKARDTYRELALRNIEYVLRITDETGHTPHYSRGQNWGQHVGEWINYYLLCSLELMDAYDWGGADLRERVKEVLSQTTQILYERYLKHFTQPPTGFLSNHATWHALLFYRAGRYFDKKDWTEYGQDFFSQRILPFQNSDGYWPEGGGIVVNYSMVTDLAVSIYAELSNDERAHASIGRSLGFHEYMSFPDGSSAVVVDTRMRRSSNPFMFLPPGFLNYECETFLENRLKMARDRLTKNKLPENSAQAFAFFGPFANALFLEVLEDKQFANKAFDRPSSLPLARIENNDWQVYLGRQVTPEHGGRFILDTQNFIEIWHHEAGYLAGTGGSKFMPLFSTLRRVNGGRSYIPDKIQHVRSDETSAEVLFCFDQDEILVRILIENEKCHIAAAVKKPVQENAYEFALVLAVHVEEILNFNQVEKRINPVQLINETARKAPLNTLIWRELKWTLPEGAVCAYPLIPYNSYTQNGLPQPTEYTVRLSLKLTTEIQTLTIQPV